MPRRVRKSRAGHERWNQLVSCLRLMNFASNNVRLYPPTHKEVTSVVAKLHETITPVVDELEDVGFGFMDELIYLEGAMSIEETASNQMLVDRFSKCRVKFLTFMKGVTTADMLEFFKVLNALATKPTGEPPGELLARQGVRTIHIVEAEVDDVASKSKLARRKTLLDWYEKTIDVLKSAQDELREKPAADLKALYRVVDDLMATVRTKGFEPFLLLPALGGRMDAHLGHAVNVGILCCALGELYGLNSGQIQTLCMAAFLHDLGRCILPVEWVHDRAPLTVFERAVVGQHPSWGFLLLARNEDIPPQLPVLAAHHHANPSQPRNNGGYFPDVFHKILNIADAYDLAAFSDLFYWRKHRADRILKGILRRRGRWFEPPLAKILVNCVGYFPVGSLVRLDDGRRGVVVRPNLANVARPKVYLFEETPAAPEPSAENPEPENPPPVILDLMDLREDGLAFKRRIEGVLSPEPGLDLREVLDAKKEYLLSYTL